MIRGIEDYFEPIDMSVGDEVSVDEIVAIAEEEGLYIKDNGNEIRLLSNDDKEVYRFKYVGVKFFGPTYVLKEGGEE